MSLPRVGLEILVDDATTTRWEEPVLQTPMLTRWGSRSTEIQKASPSERAPEHPLHHGRAPFTCRYFKDMGVSGNAQLET